MMYATHLLVAGLLCVAGGCAPSNHAACDPAVATRLTAEYYAAARVECHGYTVETCPALPGLQTNLANALEAACPR